MHSDRGPTLDQLMAIIPWDLNPKKGSNYISFNCDKCQTRRSKFVYEGTFFAKCNKLNKCGDAGHIKNVIGVIWKPDPSKRSRRDDIRQAEMVRRDKRPDRTLMFSPGLGRVHPNAARLLNERIPGVDVKMLAEKKVFGCTSDLYSGFRYLAQHYYNIYTPLYSIDRGHIVSAQARFCGINPREGINDNGKLRKTSSMKGYGGGGVTFGSLRMALTEAKIQAVMNSTAPGIILTEGDLDYLTLRACGYDNCVGVPGAMQAKRVLRYLGDAGWEGLVYIMLDGDKAGTDAMEALMDALGDNDQIQLMQCIPVGKMDANDFYRMWGSEGIHRLIRHAVPFNKIRSKFQLTDMTEDQQWLHNSGMFARGRRLDQKKSMHIRTMVKLYGKDNVGPSLFRAAVCGQFHEKELRFYSDGNDAPVEVGQRTRVAESLACPHCAAAQWNLVISKHIRDNWPDYIYYGEIVFDPKRDSWQSILDLRQELMTVTRPNEEWKRSAGEEAKSLHLQVDANAWKIRFYCGDVENNYALQALRGWCGVDQQPQRMTKSEAMKKFMLGWLSLSKFCDKNTMDMQLDLQIEEFKRAVRESRDDAHARLVGLVDTEPAGFDRPYHVLRSRWKMYSQRENLAIPTVEDIREGCRNLRKQHAEKLREKQEEFDQFFEAKNRLFCQLEGLKYNEKPDPMDRPGFSLFFTYTFHWSRPSWRTQLHAITRAPVSAGNLIRLAMGEKIKGNPTDPDTINFLDDPSASPRPVVDLVNEFHTRTMLHPVIFTPDDSQKMMELCGTRLPFYKNLSTIFQAKQREREWRENPGYDLNKPVFRSHREYARALQESGYNPFLHDLTGDGGFRPKPDVSPPDDPVPY